jgi:hypothetical protein
MNLKKKTLFILDWDDTLFPTNWTYKNGINLMETKTREQYSTYFQELDRTLSILLKKLILMGKVIIITNALEDWVNISSFIMPNTYKIVKKIKIVSARYNYKNKSPNVMDWKRMAFRDVVDEEFQDSSLMNIISIGDAEYEYQALIALQNINNPKYLKSVKFMKNPSYDVLIDQLQVLNSAVPEMWKLNKHLDLKLQNKKK